jgi:AcrR family transcriptional regulator
MATTTEPTPGARDPLTRDRVLLGAVALADERGIGALTMRNLAGELDRKPMALYHHVANKDELLDGMVDAVFGEIDLPDASAGWKTAMRRRADSARAVLLRHPWALGLMDSRTAPGPATLRHLDTVIGCLLSGGFTIEMAGHAFSLLDAYIYGYVLQEISLPFSTPEETQEVADAVVEQAGGDFPNLAAMATGYALQTEYSFEDEFHFGIDLILDGLEKMLATG